MRHSSCINIPGLTPYGYSRGRRVLELWNGSEPWCWAAHSGSNGGLSGRRRLWPRRWPAGSYAKYYARSVRVGVG